jgi:outer membrane cobalamin receptor
MSPAVSGKCKLRPAGRTVSHHLDRRRAQPLNASVNILRTSWLIASVSCAGIANAQQPAPREMAPIVTSERIDPKLAPFYERANRGAAGGHFIRRDRLDKVTSPKLTDVLREVPGLRFLAFDSSQTAERSIRLRGAKCSPTIFLDGVAAAAGEHDLAALDVGSIEGMEIYNGLSPIPGVFTTRGQERCGVIAIWTRPRRGRER